jgi:hypothetical protein
VWKRGDILGDTFGIEGLLVCPTMVFDGFLVVPESRTDLSKNSTRNQGYDVLGESCSLPSAFTLGTCHIEETHQDGMNIQPILVLHFSYSLLDDLLVLGKEHLLLDDNLV